MANVTGSPQVEALLAEQYDVYMLQEVRMKEGELRAAAGRHGFVALHPAVPPEGEVLVATFVRPGAGDILKVQVSPEWEER